MPDEPARTGRFARPPRHVRSMRGTARGLLQMLGRASREGGPVRAERRGVLSVLRRRGVGQSVTDLVPSRGNMY